MMRHRFALGLVGTAALFAGQAYAQDWPNFRGPNGDGSTPATRVPVEWDGATKKNVRWRIGLEHAANGSPIVSKGRVFLTMPEDEEGKQRSLYCFDRVDGKRLWVRTTLLDKKMPTHPTNPYCGSTPAADGERVVVWHGSAGLWCYDFDGELLWKRDFGEFRHRWGYGTSPILHEGRVLLHSGPGKQPFVALLDAKDGSTIWRQDEELADYGDDGMEPRMTGSWAMPVVLGKGSSKSILQVHPTRVVSLAYADGAVRWTAEGVGNKRGDLAYSTPAIAGDLAFLQGGYEGPSLCLRVGDLEEGDTDRRAWFHPDVASSVGTGVCIDGKIYQPFMRELVCYDAATGKLLWRERPGKGQMWGSIVVAEGRMYLMNQLGVTFVFRPDAERFAKIAENDLGEKTNSTPAVSDGELFLRTHEALWCIGDRAEAQKK
ncbi:MAG: PQQ-binding-like beta-propeller repeat protein [Planctomycetes bacterium]|nr:PQQ-binding-like beta-propeller repeat protein [Planctomycetota bacterium]